jgi:hypothetical protein
LADQTILAVAGAADTDAAAAAQVGLPVGAYRVRLHRARQRLRRALVRFGVGPAVGLLGAVAGVAGRVGRIWRTPLGKAALLGAGAVAAAGVWWGASGGSPTPRPPPPPSVAAEESLPDRNLRLFEADVRPRLQAALDSLLTGDGGTARITTVEAHGARVWVEAELRHGPPQRHVSRVELAYCTHDRRRQFFLDPWGAGVYGSVNPRDKVVLSRNRVGAPDLTAPLGGFRDVLAALERLPPDPRGADARDRDRAAVRRVLIAHHGDWCVRGDPAVRAKVGPITDRPVDEETEWRLMLEAPGFATVGGTWLDLRRLPDGRVAAPCRRFVLSADGTRIDFPLSKSWWVRPPAAPR